MANNHTVCSSVQMADFSSQISAAELNLTSEEDSSVYNSSNSSIPAAIMIPTGIMLYVLSLLTFVGNAMVLHAIRTEKRLQTVSNMFIMSLAIADLTVGLIVMPISSAYAITGDWKFGHYVCQFWLSVDYTASTASIFNLSILSLDRYWSITSPLRYLRARTKKRALVMITMAWIGASMWFIPVLGWNFILRTGNSQLPETVCETEFATNMTFKVVSSILNFYIPTTIMTFLYVRIFLAIKQRSRDIVRFGAYTASGLTTVNSKKKEQPSAEEKRVNNKEASDKASEAAIAEEAEKSTHNATNQEKIEFHRLALVALPIETNFKVNRISQLNSTSNKGKAQGTNSMIKKASSSSMVSCEAMSVFEGVTVKVEYIGGDAGAEGNNGYNNGSSKNGELTSSKELLLGLEERKKVAAEVTTVPLRQALSANYRSTITTTSVGGRNLSFTGHNHHHHHHHHNHHNHCHISSERHSGHLQCYRSKLASNSHQDQVAGGSDQLISSSSCKKSTKSFQEHNGNSIKNDVGSLADAQSRRGAKKANPNVVLAKEKKAATQLGVIVGAFILCWLPYFTLFMVVAYCGHDQCVNPTVFTITIWFGYFNSTLNPILYPLCNANFKTAFKRMLRLDCQKNEPPLQLLQNGQAATLAQPQQLNNNGQLRMTSTRRL